MAEPDGPNRAALAVMVILVVGGLWLAQHLRADGRVQDCAMAGRTNCAAVR